MPERADTLARHAKVLAPAIYLVCMAEMMGNRPALGPVLINSGHSCTVKHEDSPHTTPMILCLQLLAQQDRCVADALPDDPAALLHAGHQLEHAAAQLVRIGPAPGQETAHQKAAIGQRSASGAMSAVKSYLTLLTAAPSQRNASVRQNAELGCAPHGSAMPSAVGQ